MRTEHRVLILSIVLALALWFSDALLHRFFAQGMLPAAWDPTRPEHDILIRSLAAAYVLVFGVVIAVTVFQRGKAEKEREELILRLQDALAHVKTLRGLLPICANCKRIRDDQGYWRSVEAYVRDHSEAEFTHGLCPECASKLYPEYVGEDQTPHREGESAGGGSTQGGGSA